MSDEPSTTPEQWISMLAASLEIESPTQRETDELLALAALAAHSSERTAAPVACWLAGRSGRSASEVLAMAREMQGDG